MSIEVSYVVSDNLFKLEDTVNALLSQGGYGLVSGGFVISQGQRYDYVPDKNGEPTAEMVMVPYSMYYQVVTHEVDHG